MLFQQSAMLAAAGTARWAVALSILFGTGICSLLHHSEPAHLKVLGSKLLKGDSPQCRAGIIIEIICRVEQAVEFAVDADVRQLRWRLAGSLLDLADQLLDLWRHFSRSAQAQHSCVSYCCTTVGIGWVPQKWQRVKALAPLRKLGLAVQRQPCGCLS